MVRASSVFGGFGERIRAERETRGITLEQISEKTHISVRQLRAIEEENFSLLPGGIFNVSFVRQYARHAGLDEEAIVADFKSVAAPAELQFFQAPDDAVRSASATFAERIAEHAGRYQLTGPIVLTALLGLIAAGVLLTNWDWNKAYSFFSPATAEQAAAPRAGRAAGVPEMSLERSRPGGELPAAPEEGSKPAAPVKPVMVVLKTTKTVWVKATADGATVFQRTFQAGDAETIEANEKIHLLVGNAGGVSLSLNGKQLPPIGSLGQVRRLLLTVHGVQFLGPPKPRVRERAEAAPSLARASTSL